SIVQRTPTLGLIAAAVVSVAIVGGLAIMATRDREQSPARVSQASASKSVVVLPFRDLTGTAEGQIYSDGLAEMISSRLLQASGLRVIPRLNESSRSADPVAVARQLGAGFALRGAVQRRGPDVNVNYALLKADTGEQVAGETIAAAAGDIFTLLDRLSTSILTAFDAQAPGKRSALAGELSRSEDREAYVQALGLLQRSADERSVDKAVDTLERLLLNARDSAMINVQLARALIYKSQLGRRPALLEQASVYAERARDLDEAVPEVHVRLGHIRFLSGKHEEAVREYQRALELRPDDPVALLGIAEVNEAMGRSADAEELYRKVIKARPEHADSYNRFGLYLLSRGRFDEAEKSLERFTQLAPDTARAFLNVGAAYQAQGRYEDARKAYERSVRLNASGAALSNLATLEFFLGRYERAAEGFEKAARLSPTNHIIWINLGDAYRWAPGARDKSIGAFEKAIALAGEALAVNPRDAMTRARVAAALAKSGNLAEASVMMDAALKLDPTNPMVLYSAALVAQLRGTPATAVTWLERAARAGYPVDYLQSDPEFASVRSDPAFPRSTAPGRG
ncbi:MAG TPA: tetratricopeptide repeat protein, partial [Thermoanaerobaculia bacterium]